MIVSPRRQVLSGARSRRLAEGLEVDAADTMRTAHAPEGDLLGMVADHQTAALMKAISPRTGGGALGARRSALFRARSLVELPVSA